MVTENNAGALESAKVECLRALTKLLGNLSELAIEGLKSLRESDEADRAAMANRSKGR